MKAAEVRERMNRYGKAKRPFLFAVDFDLSEGIFIGEPLTHNEILFRTPAASNAGTLFSPDLLGSVSLFPVAYDEYKRQFETVMEGLRQGDSFLTNLTVRTPVFIHNSLREIFLATHSPYGLFVPGAFVCFSPERFVRIKNGIISTNPMKGTLNAEIENAEQLLTDDPKETAEHYTIVDLLRNDIGMVAGEVKVERFRYMDRIKTKSGTILQTSSEITGRLGVNYLSCLGDLIFRMLPAGSVSGAPKKSTVAIIQRAERISRGFYCGVFGYFDGKELDSAVMIRFIEEQNGEKYFRSGGGITVNSNPESEYREVLDKIKLPV